MNKPRSQFNVTIELPRAEVTVWASDVDNAKFKAYVMIGYAGVQQLGTITAEPVETQAIGSQR